MAAKGVTTLAVAILLLISTALASGGQGIKVVVHSPYQYEYDIVDGKIALTVFVNYTVPDSCHHLTTDVEQGATEGNYIVKIVEEKIPGDVVCAQVTRKIPSIKADVPIPEGADTVHIYVEGISKASTPENLKELKCFVLNTEIQKLRDEVKRCSTSEKCEELKKRLTEKLLAYEEICGPVENSPPEKPGNPVEKPPKIKIQPLPINIDIKNDAVVIRSSMVDITVKTDVKLENGKIISAPSGKPISTDIEEIITNIRNRIGGRVKITNAEITDDGKGPKIVAHVEKSGKILGIVPVTVHAEIVADAAAGEIINVVSPWWSFFVW